MRGNTYRGDGLLVRAENDSTIVVFERNTAGRIVRESQGDEWVASRYAMTGERIGFDTSRGAHMSNVRDPLGRPTKLFVGSTESGVQLEIGFEYDPAGAEIRRSLPGAVSVTWERDVLGRPLNHTVAGAETWSQSYSWGFDDRLTEIKDSRRGTTAFEHDHRGRLYSARFPDGTTQYRAPDEVGNLYRTPDRTDRRYLRGSLPRRADATVYEFDANGNLTSKSEGADRVWRYSWNGAGMLTEVAGPDGAIFGYAYDALGRRIRRQIHRQAVSDQSTRWIWDGHVPVHELGGEAPIASWYFEPESFSVSARIVGADSATAIVNNLGVVLAFSNENGRVVPARQLDSYGASRHEASSVEDKQSGICQRV